MQQNQKIIILDQLGDGLTSTVSRCKIGEDVFAIKVFKDTCSLKSRIREIQALSALNDCQIIKMIASDPQYSWIVFPLLFSKDLFDFVALEKKAFSESVAKKLLMKISSVVCMIHLKGFSHRDLKLENILIDIDTLEIIISDLGFAEPIYQNTVVTRSMGTSGYMAPELQSNTMDGRLLPDKIETNALQSTDVFALGVCLFILTFAHPPFTSTKRTDNCAYWKCIIAGKWDTFWKACERHKPARSRELKNLLELMLNPNPKKRPTVQQILDSPWMQNEVATQEQYFIEMKLRKDTFDSQKA